MQHYYSKNSHFYVEFLNASRVFLGFKDFTKAFSFYHFITAAYEKRIISS